MFRKLENAIAKRETRNLIIEALTKSVEMGCFHLSPNECAKSLIDLQSISDPGIFAAKKTGAPHPPLLGALLIANMATHADLGKNRKGTILAALYLLAKFESWAIHSAKLGRSANETELMLLDQIEEKMPPLLGELGDIPHGLDRLIR